MLRKLTKYFSFLLLILVSTFLAYPLWNSWLINTYLPSGIILKEVDSNYPGFGQVFVNKLLLDVNGIEIRVDNLLLKYDLSLIDVENINLQLPTSEKEQSQNTQVIGLESFKLPEIDFQIFSFLEKLRTVNIKHMTLIEQQNTYQFSDFNFDNKKVKTLQLKLEQISEYYQNSSSLDLFLSLDLEAKYFGVRLLQNKDELVNFSYHKEKTKTAANLKADFSRLKQLFPSVFSDIPIETKQLTTLDLVEDNKTDISKLEFTTTLLAQETTTRLEQEITIPLSILATSNLNKNLNINLSLKANTLDSFSFIDDQTTLNLQPITVNFETQISKTSSTNDNLYFQIKNTTFNLFSSRLDFQSNGSELFIEKYKLMSNLQNITFNLNKLNQTKWHIDNKLISERLTAQYNKNTKINSKLEINTELDKSDMWRANGKIHLAELEVSDPSFSLKGLLSVDFEQTSLDFNSGEILLNLDTHTNHLTDMDFDSLNLKSKLLLNKKLIEGDGTILINEQNLTPFSLKFSKASSELLLDLQENQLSNQIFNHFLNIIGKQNKLPLSIIEGETTHSGELLISDDLQIDSQIKVEEMLFQFGENEIQGLNVDHKLTSLTPLQFESDISIKKIEFSSGLSIDSLTAKIISISENNIVVKNISGQLLEGKLLAHELKFGSEGLEESVIRLEQISLTELIFFLDVEGLYGEGKLNFLLPLSMKAGSPTVKNGTFVSEAEGIIKYSTGEPDPQENENIALQALRNFHYRSMDGTISYNRNGKYHIKLHLVGSNPDLYDGYPIDFVLHLRGELTGVFRSLFLTGNFEDAVMQQVKAGQLKERKTKSPLTREQK